MLSTKRPAVKQLCCSFNEALSTSHCKAPYTKWVLKTWSLTTQTAWHRLGKIQRIITGKFVKLKRFSIHLTMLHQLYWIRRSATRYGLDGPGIGSRGGGARFSTSVQTSLGAHPSSCTTSTGVTPRGRGIDHKPHLASEIIEGVES